jgi:hypothetical protein
MVNTASFSPTASGWVGWQSATLWTLLRVYTGAATRHLMASLADDQLQFDLGTHHACAIGAGLAARQDQLQNEQIFLDRDKQN